MFLAAPVLVVIPLSFNVEPYFSYPMPGLSLRWYQEVLGSEAWQRAALNSVLIAALATGLAMCLGTLAALGLSRARFRFKALALGIIMSPLIMPVIVTAVGIYFFFAPLHLIGTYTGIILGHTVLAAPFVVLTVTATLTGLDRNLTKAAASLGAGPLRVFANVTMPLMLPGLVAGALFAFVTSFDEAVIVLFLAGPEQHTLPIEMWKGVRENISPAILAVACLLVCVSFLALLSAEWLRRRVPRARGSRVDARRARQRMAVRYEV
jgi:putative spermidine/putrescine transport system permease protein